MKVKIKAAKVGDWDFITSNIAFVDVKVANLVYNTTFILNEDKIEIYKDDKIKQFKDLNVIVDFSDLESEFKLLTHTKK